MIWYQWVICTIHFRFLFLSLKVLSVFQMNMMSTMEYDGAQDSGVMGVRSVTQRLLVVTWCCNVVSFDKELYVHCLSPPSCKWKLAYAGVNLQDWWTLPSINDSHLHSIMKNRYKHHPYQYAPQVLEKALMLNLKLYVPISEEQFTLIEGKKVHDFLFDFCKKNFTPKNEQKTPKNS